MVQFLIDTFSNDVALANIDEIIDDQFVDWLKSHQSNIKDFKLLHPLNITLISVTLLVSKLLKSKDFKLLHWKNIRRIVVTLLVSKLLISSVCILSHW